MKKREVQRWRRKHEGPALANMFKEEWQIEMKSGELLRSGPRCQGEQPFPVDLHLLSSPWPPHPQSRLDDAGYSVCLCVFAFFSIYVPSCRQCGLLIIVTWTQVDGWRIDGWVEGRMLHPEASATVKEIDEGVMWLMTVKRRKSKPFLRKRSHKKLWWCFFSSSSSFLTCLENLMKESIYSRVQWIIVKGEHLRCFRLFLIIVTSWFEFLVRRTWVMWKRNGERKKVMALVCFCLCFGN